MRPRKPFPAGSVEKLRSLLQQAERAEDVRRIQAVLMRALDDSPPEHIATVVGMSVATVRSLHSQFLRQGVAFLAKRPGRGGSRRRHLDETDERRLLDGFISSAKAGGVVHVGEIRAEIERRLGRPIAASTTYRILARHGWRKVAPRPHHPNRDPEAAAAFKKHSRKSSRQSADR